VTVTPLLLVVGERKGAVAGRRFRVGVVMDVGLAAVHRGVLLVVRQRSSMWLGQRASSGLARAGSGEDGEAVSPDHELADGSAGGSSPA